MDIRDILKSFDNISEATTTTDKGTVHKSGPGEYGNRHGSDDVKDQYGKPIGRMSLGKMGLANEPKRGKGRPPNPDKPKEYDSTALNKAMGIGKAPKPTGKPSVKHSLKEYFDQMDQALVEAGAIEIKPASQMPKQPGQPSQPGQPQQVAGQPAQNTQVIAQGNKTLGTVNNPQLAQQIKQSIGKGEMTLMPDQQMAEDGENWIKGAIKHPGAFTAKAKSHGMTPAQFRAKVLAHKEDYPANTEKQAQLAKTLSKMHEAEAPQYFAQSSPLSTANRGVLEGKKGVNPFAKKDTKKKPDADKDGIPDYAEDGKGKNDLKKKGAAPKKGVNPFAKKDDKDEKKGAAPKKGVNPFAKKKVKEGMDSKLQAARLRGKSHALAKEAYNCHYDDMEESRCYHEGFKEGLDECYGQMPILGRTAVGEMGQGPEVATMASYGADDLGMDEGNAFTAGLAKTPHGGKFKVGGSTFTDRTRYDAPLDEFAFESLDKQLNSLLESEVKVAEGMTVSISKGQQGSPDSVSVSAQDGEADQLLSIIKSAGMGLFGGDEQNGYGAPQGSTAAPGGIEVVDDHDGMMALMKKLSGAGGDMPSGGDYENEEGSDQEEHMHGSEEPCESCGGTMEENHQCGSGQQSVMGEDETEDQMTDEVAEANAPDSGADNTDADVAGNAATNSALATADAGEDEEEGQVYSNPTESYYKDPDGDEDSAADKADKADDERRSQEEKLEEGNNCKKCDCNPCKCETVAESFANLYKKLAFLSEESTEKKDEKAEKAGKKVAKDIEYDEGHKGKDDNKAEKAGKKVTKDIEYDDKKDKKVDESYANSADDTFEADIGFMMNVITGGLNKQKSTGQTTVPVISGQKNRMGVDGLGNPLKESTDLLKDYRKLSGL